MLTWNDLIGRRFGQYEIVAELGRGGSSRVYRAHATALGYDVAIKVIPNDAEDRIGFVQRFEREVEVIRKLSHPNIVRVYDADKTDEIVFLVLQCVNGGTLRQRLGGRPLPAPQAAAYVIQMAHALHHAHLQGIIHRDVKPSNMLVDADDTNHLLLTDFGTAKIQGARGLTKSGTTIGTPEYMSPEQAEGREIDQRADIYALGCVLYEALATRPPFIGSTPVSVLYQQVHSRPASIRSYNPTAPRELARIIEIALAKRPSDRYGTAEALAEALTPFAAGVIQATPAPWMAGANLGMTPSAPLSGQLAPPRSFRAQRTAPIPAAPNFQSSVAPTPATLPATGPLAPFAAPAADAPDVAAPGLPAWLATAQQPASAPNLTEGRAAGLEANEGPSELTGDSGALPARRTVRPTIPLPSFRLPAKNTDPNGQTLTSAERANIERMLAQVEQAEQATGAQQGQPQGRPLPTFGEGADAADAALATAESAPLVLGSPAFARDHISGAPALLPGAEGPVSAKGRKATLASAPGLAEVMAQRPLTPTTQIPAYPFAPPASLTHEQAVHSLASPTPETLAPSSEAPDGYPVATRESGRINWPDATPDEPYADEEQETSPTAMAVARQVGVSRRRVASRGRRSWMIGGAVAALLALAVVSWLALDASGLAFLAGRGSAQAHPTATTRILPTATATLRPTATATVPAVTPTPNTQQVLDQQAAASFRAVTLASFVDGSCAAGNSQSHFSAGERIYVNLCTSYSPANGPMTIQVRQNGVVVATLIYGQYLSANGSYWYYHSLNPGSYDALITIDLNGYQAVARDLSFSVG